jgi:Protein of unknown function C-terminus (DUF2399)
LRPAIDDPFRNIRAGFDNAGSSLESLLAWQEVERSDPVFVFVHMASPRFAFIDKGKTAVSLPEPVATGLGEMIVKATARWRRQKRAEIRHADAVRRRTELLAKPTKPMSIKDATWQVMAYAYAHAAGDVGLANARQIMYAARPAILELTRRSQFGDQYFTQTLLPDYLNEFPRETENWDVVFDDRGHFAEPHTGHTIGLGTLAVRGYLAECREPQIIGAAIAPARVSTFGPNGRYRSALFIEKEGFISICEHTRIAERFDTALMSTKGMSVVAARRLIDALAAHGVRVFVLHDFDVSGFSIRKTFTESGRRHKFQNNLDFVDIGLRLDDVRELGLPSEPVALTASRETLAERLAINGAADDEIAFLMTGQRVELNAMTSDQFIAFLERKLTEHGAAKVVPDSDTLASTYRAMTRSQIANARFAAELQRLLDEPVAVPPGLAERVCKYLEEHPAQTWDGAIEALAREG